MRTIAHISDLHFGRIDPRIAEALAEDLNRQPPSVLVVSGDLTQRGRHRQYAQAADYLPRLPRPQIVVPGNHDVPLWDVVRRFFFPLNRYRHYISQNLFPEFQDDELFALGVNTSRSFTRTSGWLDKQQLRYISQRMSAAPPQLFKVLVTHHPFIPPPRRPDSDVLLRGSWALEQMEHCGIDLLLAGHLHLAYHDDVRSHYVAAPRSVLSIQAGTATSTRLRGEPNAYNWITIDRDLVTVAVRAWNGQRFQESLVTRYNRTDGRWRRAKQLAVTEPVASTPHMAPTGDGNIH